MKLVNFITNAFQSQITHDYELNQNVHNQTDCDNSKRIKISITDCQLAIPMITLVDILDINKTQKDEQSDIIRILPEDLINNLIINYSDLPKDGKFNYITTECYHGTSLRAAKNIMRKGFRVGPGDACGSGIYFSIGGISIAQNFLKERPCIIRARVDWGNVAYLDREIGTKFSGEGDRLTRKAIKMGYDSLISASSFSADDPTVGVVLGYKYSYIRPPRIEVLELIEP